MFADACSEGTQHPTVKSILGCVCLWETEAAFKSRTKAGLELPLAM